MKLLMALSGALFVFYVLLHMYGNLKIFGGTEAFDEYALHLRTLLMPILPFGGFLWIFRFLLIVALIAHAYAAFWLWSRANGARTTRYVAKQAAKATLRSRMMRWGGVALLLFLVWHLLQFTILKVSVNADATGPSVENNPYQLVVASFQVPWMTILYLVAMIALGLHLAHGIFSSQQTLGWTSSLSSYRRAKAVGYGLAAVIAVGFMIPPFAILFGLIK